MKTERYGSLARLDRIWRILATGFCFLMFGLGGLILSLLVFPLQRFCIRNEERRKLWARRSVHHSFRFFVGLVHYSGAIQISVQDAERIRKLQGQLVIANHPTLLDVVILISLMPNADCVVKHLLWQNPFIRGVVKGTGYISNANPDALLEDCRRSLAAGNNLIIFPEGTRTRPDEPIQMQRGAANIALRAQTPVTALWIRSQPSTLVKGMPWYQVSQRRARIAVGYLQPWSLEPYQEQPVSLAARVLTRDWQTLYQKVLEPHARTEIGHQATDHRDLGFGRHTAG